VKTAILTKHNTNLATFILRYNTIHEVRIFVSALKCTFVSHYETGVFQHSSHPCALTYRTQRERIALITPHYATANCFMSLLV